MEFAAEIWTKTIHADELGLLQLSGVSCRIKRSPTAKLPRARDVDCWALKDCVTRRFFIGVFSTQISTTHRQGAGAE